MKRLLSIMLMGVLGSSPIEQQVELMETIPMETKPFIQGLDYVGEDKILIGTGKYEKSSIQMMDLKTGKIVEQEDLEGKYFGEGVTVADQFIWQFTWKEGQAFKRDLNTLDIIDTLAYDGEGWGLTYDGQGKILWASDGTDNLIQRNPDTFEMIKKIQVTYKGQPVERLNELEFANGSLYANIWQTNWIVKINPESGQVEKIWDLGTLVQLIEQEISTPDQVLNGIAHVEGNIFYISGKEFPIMWKVKLNE